ncbi:hypothetical protein BDW02DRAFT_344395 [Decorospora gaudefroyi]|uniref:Uncharacterized protein n=1 Tax=Decorospora gaudefroyi TaxID=184978 RepID=A0A6A5KDR3_9PLEO|nr:hypothetical protein BDW02DRAFT_344395 [Decorospora gaudefroyi]
MNTDSLPFSSFELHIPSGHHQLIGVVPESLWDHTHRSFFQFETILPGRGGIVFAVEFIVHLNDYDNLIIALCDYRPNKPALFIFREPDYPRQRKTLFQREYRENGIFSEDLVTEMPELLALTSFTVLTIGNNSYRIRASLEDRWLDHYRYGKMRVPSLILSVEHIEPTSNRPSELHDLLPQA